MKTETYIFKGQWNAPFNKDLDTRNTLIVIFGPSDIAPLRHALDYLIKSYPQSIIVGASSAGEIAGDELYENSLVACVMQFESTVIRLSQRAIESPEASFASGVELAESLKTSELKALFVLSDGLSVNGSQLAKGFNSVISPDISVTGGMAADDARFIHTWVIVDGEIKSHYIIAVGFYGNNVRVSHGSKGGWDKLGVSRIVTQSASNVLFELDNKPALEIYKQYLGSRADELPAAGLFFPLMIEESESKDEEKLRTILGVDEAEQSITFAGDIPTGSTVTFMKSNYDRLVDGAENAAKEVQLDDYSGEPIVCIAISCVGRKLVLKQRTEEELEATLGVLPEGTEQVGFYSHGEISPLASGKCDLHNQTMTLTLIWESNA